MLNKNNNNTNFWISYADLMAGLLFVFILLIGAIIVKYSLLQNESKELELNLQKEKLALEKHKEELKNKENSLKNVLNDLDLLQKKFDSTKDDLKASLLENEKLENELKIKNEELNKNIDSVNDLQAKLTVVLDEKDKLAISLKELEDISKQKDEKLDALLEEVLAKKALIDSFEEKNRVLDDEIKVMGEKLKKSEELHEVLTKDLESTKQKIKSFTGLKVKVISLLKSKLGNKIEIDPKDGSLRLSSNVLFDEGKYELKDESRMALKDALYDYFQTILDNPEINEHVDKIVIEGHTNSKGTYLYNLELSQKRAFSVMDFLLTLDFKNHEKLKKLIAASGRSFLDPVFTKNGTEDADASRRIEIKLSLKNEDAIKEIAKLLE